MHVNGTRQPLLAKVRPLLEIANLVRGERELEDLLDAIAETIASGLGWQTVVINLYRPAWDDFQVATVCGNDDARSALLGQTSEWSDWEPLLDERFERRGAYVVRGDDVDWNRIEMATFVPQRARAGHPDAWDAEDSLIVPLAHSQSRLLGILSIDEPLNGRLPTDDELDLLCAMAAQAAHAVEQLQRHAETRRHRAALEHLHEVSTRLSAVMPPKQVLDAVSEGVRRALGFEKVAVLLREGDGFVVAASSGWTAEDEGARISLSGGEFDAMLDPQFEREGCYLLTCDEALARCRSSDYASQLNGRGPLAWNRHWLVVPLQGEAEEPIGFIWPDDPSDRLLPSPEKLRLLRMFANQAVTALELARTFAAEHEATELLRATVTSSPLATIHIDRDGIVRAWNAAAEELYGWSAGDVLGKPYPRTTAAQELEFTHTLAPALAGESYRGIEVVRTTRDGRQIAVRVSAAPLFDADENVVGAIAIHEDITARRQVEATLRETQELYRSVVDTLTDVIVVLDVDGTVVFASRAAERVLGYHPNEVVGRRIADLMHPDDDAERRLAEGHASLASDVRLMHASGGWIAVQLQGTTVRDHAGNAKQTVVVIREPRDRAPA